MSIFSMKPKETPKVSDIDRQKSKAGVGASLQPSRAAGMHKESGEKKSESQGFVRDAEGVLVASHMTEKSMRSSETGTYTFRIARGATKPQVKHAVEKTYRVHVVGVRVINRKGHAVRVGRFEGRRSDSRLARVTVRHGEVIQL